MTARRGLVSAVVAAAAALLLDLSGGGLPAPPVTQPDRLDDWWNAQGTALATLSVVRVAGLALCCYLMLISVLAVVAAITRWRWMTMFAWWVATPALRRMLIGGSLAVALSAPSGAAASSAPYSVTDIGAAAAAEPQFTAGPDAPAAPAEHSVVDVGPATAWAAEPYTARDIGSAAASSPAPVHTAQAHTAADISPTPETPPEHLPPEHLPSNEADTHRNAPADISPTPETPPEHLPPEGSGNTWIVMPGDNLWDIAADIVAERAGDTDPRNVDQRNVLDYWLRLIDANSEALGDNPDLIFPGQIIRLPS